MDGGTDRGATRYKLRCNSMKSQKTTKNQTTKKSQPSQKARHKTHTSPNKVISKALKIRQQHETPEEIALLERLHNPKALINISELDFSEELMQYNREVRNTGAGV